jgi:6-pyruvoyltetrahydropterin/6-carboxytetrahydropterin synthase
MPAFLTVNHPMQVAHRLHLLPGKCQNIHGHSMKVVLTVRGEYNDQGFLCDAHGDVIDFGDLKRVFRGIVDQLDHHLLLSVHDPLVELNLPGMLLFGSDPSVEFLARYIYNLMIQSFYVASVEVIETATNSATYRREGY